MKKTKLTFAEAAEAAQAGHWVFRNVKDTVFTGTRNERYINVRKDGNTVNVLVTVFHNDQCVNLHFAPLTTDDINAKNWRISKSPLTY